MYRISQLAHATGLSRSTLLYYEKLGVLQGQRSANGYRYYQEEDRQRLVLIKLLQSGGLTLKECLACVKGGVNRTVVEQRLAALDEEIARKQKARHFLAELIGREAADIEASSLRSFHQKLEGTAPGAHTAWLQAQGFQRERRPQVALAVPEFYMGTRAI